MGGAGLTGLWEENQLQGDGETGEKGDGWRILECWEGRSRGWREEAWKE